MLRDRVADSIDTHTQSRRRKFKHYDAVEVFCVYTERTAQRYRGKREYI